VCIRAFVGERARGDVFAKGRHAATQRGTVKLLRERGSILEGEPAVGPPKKEKRGFQFLKPEIMKTHFPVSRAVRFGIRGQGVR